MLERKKLKSRILIISLSQSLKFFGEIYVEVLTFLMLILFAAYIPHRGLIKAKRDIRKEREIVYKRKRERERARKIEGRKYEH